MTLLKNGASNFLYMKHISRKSTYYVFIYGICSLCLISQFSLLLIGEPKVKHPVTITDVRLVRNIILQFLEEHPEVVNAMELSNAKETIPYEFTALNPEGLQTETFSSMRDGPFLSLGLWEIYFGLREEVEWDFISPYLIHHISFDRLTYPAPGVIRCRRLTLMIETISVSSNNSLKVPTSMKIDIWDIRDSVYYDQGEYWETKKCVILLSSDPKEKLGIELSTYMARIKFRGRVKGNW